MTAPDTGSSDTPVSDTALSDTARSDTALYGRSFADVYDDWYADISDPTTVVAACASRLPAQAHVVEFGSGSGRLARPLAAAGFSVTGIDASIEMLSLTPDAPQLESVAGDMAAVGLAGGCADAVVIAYNTLFNLTEPHHQDTCLAEARRLLKPQGRLVIECFIAAPVDTHTPVSTTLRSSTNEQAVVIVSTSERAKGRAQRIVGSHIELRRDELICRPWELYYRPPGELDAAANRAGLQLTERFADWQGSSFEPLGQRHVSWYRQTI